MKYSLEVLERYRDISRSLERCWHTCEKSASTLNWPKLSKYRGRGRSKSQPLLRLHIPNCVWRFLRHIETFLHYLGGVDTCVSRVPVPKTWDKLSKYIGEGEVNISVSIKTSCTKYFLQVSETHRNICRSLGRCWHACGQNTGTQNPGQVEQINWGIGKVNISAFIRALCIKSFLDVPETHRNFLDQMGGVDTPASAQNSGQVEQIHGVVGGQYLSFY